MAADRNDPPKSIASRPLRGLMGMVIGALFAASGFLVLAYGEARMNQGAAVSRSLNANEQTARFGAQVTATGALDAVRPAIDPLLRGDFVYVQRIVETCVWIESPGKTDAAPPVYKKRWVRDVPDSRQFKVRGHDNPGRTSGKEGSTLAMSGETFGEGLLIEKRLLRDPIVVLGAETLAPSRTDVQGARLVQEQWAYLASSTECKDGGAGVGDQRVGFRVLRKGDLVTAFGVLRGAHIEAPQGATVLLTKGSRLALVDAVNHTRSPYAWLFRGGGGLLLWIGLSMFLGPLVQLVAWIPLLGGFARGAARLATLGIALLITLGVVYEGYGLGLVQRLTIGP